MTPPIEKATIRRIVPFLAAIFVGFVFILDVLTPPYYVVWMLYAVPILPISLLYRERYTYFITASASILTVIGFFFPFPMEHVRMIAVINRGIGIIVFWLVATIALLRERATDQVARQAEKILQAEQLKSRFLADASHELRTPIAVIQSSLDLSFGTKSKKVVDPYRALREIRNEAAHMSKIVDNLTAVIRSGARVPDKKSFKTVDIGEILLTIVRRYQKMADNKLIKIHAGVMPRILVRGDAGSLDTLFNNVIENAIKYGKRSGWIRIEMARSGHLAKLDIVDNGIGIPSDDLPYIFDRFYRAENHGNKKGAGLGLAIAKSIAEEHGGAISVTSLSAETTFSIKLPVSRTDIL